MKIYFDDRPCGSGKTYSELMHMVSTPGRYLLAVDRRDAMSERMSTIAELSAKLGKQPVVVVIRSGTHAEVHRSGSTTVRTTRSVRADVEAVPERHALHHVIVIVTHEALKISDLAGFEGWTVVIDETPSIMDRQPLVTTLSREFLQEHYDLTPVGTRCVVTCKSKATPAEFRRDTLTQEITVMHSRVCCPRTTVIADVRSWEDLEEDGSWMWTSIFSPEQFSIFDKVKILANAFPRSLTFSMWSKIWPEISWLPECRRQLRPYLRRPMRIRYFAEKHTATRSLFGSEEGKRRLKLVANAIEASVDPATHIWTCNKADEPSLRAALSSSQWLSPRQAGSNAYADRTAVSAIYTAKASPDERTLFKELGIDPHVATETREFETIFQFVSRSAVRDPKSQSPLIVHVYDHAQARYLADLFQATNYVDCTLELVDLGFAHHTAPRPGPKKRPKTRSQIAAAKEKARGSAKQRKRRQRRRDRDKFKIVAGKGKARASMSFCETNGVASKESSASNQLPWLP